MCGSARAATLIISPMATSHGKEKCIANVSARSKVKISTINESEVKVKQAAGYFLENQCILVITSNNLRRVKEYEFIK